MSHKLINDKVLYGLVTSPGENGTPLGKYGRMAMYHLRDTDPRRFTFLMMMGVLMGMMHGIDDEATEKVESITQNLLSRDPVPKTDDVLERARHLNAKRDIAEELVINEIVLVPR